MKTKFRILVTVCTLVFAGASNAKTTANSEERNSGLTRANESWAVLNEKIASFENELNGGIDYQKEAQMVIRLIADMAEAKAVQNVMEKGFVAPAETCNSSVNESVIENNNETIDFLEEARLITRSIVDKEEAKAVQKVIEKGFVAPVETSNSSVNESVTESNSETIDFLEEARLMTKSIVDQEEAKMVQKVMEKGFVAPVETSSSFENEAVTESFDETVDFLKEAQLMTKSVVDKEVAKMVRKMIDDGRLADLK